MTIMRDPESGPFVEYVKRLIAQRPVAIVQYGSSLRPEDYVEGSSDIDLLVISERPLNDVANTCGCDYLFMHPNTFVSSLAAGNMYTVSAFQSGRVLYDPHRFFDALRALEAAGFQVRPGLVALGDCMQATDVHLSAAISHYFWTPATAQSATVISTSLYKAAKGIGGFYAIAASGRDPHGFSAICASLSRYEQIAALMRRMRELYCGKRLLRIPASARVYLTPDDDAGAAILEVERARVEGFGLVPGRSMTNDLVNRFLQTGRSLDCCLLSEITTSKHAVVGRSEDALQAFGLVNTRSAKPAFVTKRFETTGSSLRMNDVRACLELVPVDATRRLAT